jgi:hypothetical protein
MFLSSTDENDRRGLNIKTEKFSPAFLCLVIGGRREIFRNVSKLLQSLCSFEDVFLREKRRETECVCVYVCV